VSVTLTYESQLSRVKISANGVGNADSSFVQRSLNQITWTTVRGGADAPVIAGVITVYDYEFSPGVVNYYRVITAKDITFVGAGAVATGNNSTLAPALPGGRLAGDLILVNAVIHNSGVGSPNTPAGYTLLVDNSNQRIFGKLDGGAESAPSVSYTGGVAGPTQAQTAVFRNVQLSVDAFAKQLNTSQQNIPYPALDVRTLHSLLLFAGWKLNAWLSVATLSSLSGDVAVEIGDSSTTQSSIGSGIVWDHVIQTTTTAVDVPTGSFVVSGGSSAISRGLVASLPAVLLTQTASITPVISQVWLKSIGMPFLNRGFYCVSKIGDEQRDDRTGLFEVINRNFPIAVTDVRQSKEVTIEVITQTTQEWHDLDFILGLGAPMYLQTPLNYPLDSMHVVIRRTSKRRPLLQQTCGNDWRVYELPLREVAPPGDAIVGSTITWQGVINAYATWQDVLNAETSWFDLMQNIGTPADVIVP
jgi:hypothetical protein